MQNEKQWHLVEDNESQFFSQNVFDEQTKGTPSGKMLAQAWKFWLRMNNFTGKTVWNTKQKDQQKGFHMILGVQNRWKKRYGNFFLTRFPEGVQNEWRKKNPLHLFSLWDTQAVAQVCVETFLNEKKEVWLRNLLRWGLHEANQIKPTNESIKKSPVEFLTCLKVSTKLIAFFLWDSCIFSKTFCRVVLKSILIFFFLFCYLKTTVFGLWKLFSHHSYLLRSYSFGI